MHLTFIFINYSQIQKKSKSVPAKKIKKHLPPPECNCKTQGLPQKIKLLRQSHRLKISSLFSQINFYIIGSDSDDRVNINRIFFI